MSLLSERDRQTVQTHLAGLTHDVTLLFFTQTIGAPETALIARQVVDEVAGLSDRVTVEEVNLILDRERARSSESTGFRPSCCCATAPTRACAFSARRPATSSGRWSSPSSWPAPTTRA